VYLNGVPSFVALPHLRAGAVPVLGHVHELEFALGRSLPPGEGALLGRPDRYVAVSEAVAENLVDGHAIDRDRVSVCHGFVDDAAPSPVRRPEDLRAELAIPADAPVVGAVGDVIWRKGPDLFVRLGLELDAALGRDRPPVHLVWVGGAPGRGTWAETVHDARAQLDGRVHLVGEQPDVSDWYGLFDVFALTSREDPFPLVVLEAAQAGVPVVAFDQGGAPELLAPRPDSGPAGALVPALDVVAMAQAVRDLLDDPQEAAAVAARAQARVAAECVTSVGGPRLLAEIEALL
jgi:glycosyltransferase involved in cell wall biosynthesis